MAVVDPWWRVEGGGWRVDGGMPLVDLVFVKISIATNCDAVRGEITH